MKKIAVYGAGGFGREVACMLRHINNITPTWDLVGFFDDGKIIGYETGYGKILGGLQELNHYSEMLSVVIAIGNPQVVSVLVPSITNPLIDFPNIIAPDVLLLDKENITLGKGNLICSNCWLSCNVHFGNFNVLNVGVTVGHDSVLGDFNSLMPATKISGEVKIGNCNFFGVSSVVLQRIVIGNNTVVGANSLIIKKTKDGFTYIGSPALKVEY